MGYYRKKPVVIEAYRLEEEPAPDWALLSAAIEFVWDGAKIHTLEGTMRALKGDWIIKGVKGELYPCKNDIFEATYEPATPTT